MTKNNWIVIGIILFLLIGLIAIANNSSFLANRNATTTPSVINNDDGDITTPTPAEIEVAYGDFTLALGQTALLPEGSLKIISVDEDSRCPIDAQCIQAGRVVTTVEYSDNGVIKQGKLESNKSIVRGSEQITLNDITPAPRAGVSIADSDYIFNLRAVTTAVVSPTSAPTPSPVVSGGCFVGGCSSQICSDEPGAISTCEYREEYACYRTAKCERQTNGQCGWTQTAALQMCLANTR